MHVRENHGFTSKEYEDKFKSSIKCAKTKENYSIQNAKNGNWIQRAKDKHQDLTEYKKKMGKSVSKSIMTNDQERKSRSERLSDLNKRDDFRERSRLTARKTSSRPDILEHRSKNLSQWRNDNREEFYEKCIKPALKSRSSKPEFELFKILQSVEGYNFRHNQVVKSNKFTTKSSRKQIDIADKEKRVYVEFDGIIHFHPIKGKETLIETQARDKLLDEHILEHNWTLIRVSYDQFSYKNGGFFSESCLERIFQILKKPASGIYKIGTEYERYEDSENLNFCEVKEVKEG